MIGRSKQAYTWGSERTQPVEKWLVEHVCEPMGANPARILVVAGALLVAVAGYVNPGTFLNSISAELFGIVIAAVVVDAVNERRQREQLKKQLIRRMGMNIRDVAVLAAYELEHEGWLRDGSLRGARLSNANLQNANLQQADLIGANLNGANLREAELHLARLDGVQLSGTNLSQAKLRGVNLEGSLIFGADFEGAEMSEIKLGHTVFFGRVNLAKADLEMADLTGASLRDTSLTDADLYLANLYGCSNWTFDQLEEAKSLAGATMPDGEVLGWEGDWFHTPLEGRLFDEWKKAVLECHGGTDESPREYDGSVIER